MAQEPGIAELSPMQESGSPTPLKRARGALRRASKTTRDVVVGFFLLGKGQLYGYILAGKIILDSTGTFDKIKEVFGPYTEPIFWVLTAGAVYYTYQQSAEIQKKTADFETLSKEEALEREKSVDKSATVFEKMKF